MCKLGTLGIVLYVIEFTILLLWRVHTEKSILNLDIRFKLNLGKKMLIYIKKIIIKKKCIKLFGFINYLAPNGIQFSAKSVGNV